MRIAAALLTVTACAAPPPGGYCDDAPIAPSLARPAFHFSTPVGWLNDPAGLVFFEGEYHLFFQHNPGADVWGAMSWGHAVSRDLRTWESLPIALTPDADLGEAYTGSAVVGPAGVGGVCGTEAPCLVAMFTRAGGTDRQQKQAIAVSHDRGRTFVLQPREPVLRSPGVADFRDPKVLWHDPSKQWIAVVGTRGGVLLHASTDLLRWTAIGSFQGENVPSAVWECPDLFPITAPDGTPRWVLKADLAPSPLVTGEARYWLGAFDGTTFTPDLHPEGRRLDGATDFYAAESWFGLAARRRVWIAWLDDWGYALQTPSTGWRGVLTVPRELSLVRGAAPGEWLLAQKPVPELEAAFATCSIAWRQDLPLDGRETLVETAPEALSIEAVFTPGDATEVGLSLLGGDGEETTVGYDAAAKAVFLDRTISGTAGFSLKFPARFERPVALVGGQATLRILLDRQTIEVFAGDGTAVLTAQVFPTNTKRRIQVYATGEGATLTRFDAHGLAR